ncbi:MAG: phosphomannomutase [Desulfomonilaceae bacterium]
MIDSASAIRNSFKAYDIRGRIPDELNEEIAFKIGRAYATFLKPQKICLGRDVRLSSSSLALALAEGINYHGCDVLDIGICPTEMVYFATSYLNLDGGIMVTASHNPMDYNGMKLIREDSKPISGDSGIQDIASMVIDNQFSPRALKKGSFRGIDLNDAYIKHLLSYVDTSKISPLKVVANCGNGCAGPILEKLKSFLPLNVVMVFPEPDGRFPNGIPNPILPENRSVTSDKVLANKADIGLAWDGDADRCFFFDEAGEFLEGYYIVGFLAQESLKVNPGSKIVHDPRLIWNTTELVKEYGGIPVMSKAGHAFIKEKMRQEDAAYGGEMSAHHYFRNFAYCDSGMIPWLLLVQALSSAKRPLSELVKSRIDKYPVSGEINRTVGDPHAVIAQIEAFYKGSEITTDYIDGLSMEFPLWRFNLRPSNTEPVIRLNLETRSDKSLLKRKTEEILSLIDRLN